MFTSIDPVTNLPKPVEIREPKTTLNQQDFLMIMIEQLKNQDPLKLADSTQFMNQFMTMGNFEATQKMSNSINKTYDQQQQMYARSLVGAVVQVKVGQEDPVVGFVDRAWVENGKVGVSVKGVDYDSADIVQIIDPSVASQFGDILNP